MADFPFLVTRIMGFFSEEKGFQGVIKRVNSFTYIVIMTGYLLSPALLIPEFIVGVIGIFDNLVIFAGIFCVVAVYYLSEVCWQRVKRFALETPKD